MEARGDVVCLVCKYTVSSNLYDEKVIQYTVKFNAVQVPKVNIRGLNDVSTQPVPPSQAAKKEEGEEGPVIDRKCPKCNSEKMSYAAIQLRSADEGQTVFFTCVKCKYKESENS